MIELPKEMCTTRKAHQKSWWCGGSALPLLWLGSDGSCGRREDHPICILTTMTPGRMLTTTEPCYLFAVFSDPRGALTILLVWIIARHLAQVWCDVRPLHLHRLRGWGNTRRSGSVDVRSVVPRPAPSLRKPCRVLRYLMMSGSSPLSHPLSCRASLGNRYALTR